MEYQSYTLGHIGQTHDISRYQVKGLGQGSTPCYLQLLFNLTFVFMANIIFSGSQVRVLIDGLWYVCNRTHRNEIEYWSVANAKVLAEFLKSKGYAVVAIDEVSTPQRVEINKYFFYFQGEEYHLNQCDDLIEWVKTSKVGEFSFYYDKLVFHTSDGFIAAYRDDINNNWKF